jgi:hypothetical protein
MIEANISADVQPAASAMSIVTIISCPAPFERLDIANEIPLQYQLLGDFP